jgi:hypothetical protein
VRPFQNVQAQPQDRPRDALALDSSTGQAFGDGDRLIAADGFWAAELK